MICMVLLLCATVSSYASTLTIRLGKGADCTGYNICSMSTEPAQEYNEVQAEVTITKSKHLQVVIPRKNLNDQAYLKYFATGEMSIDGDYTLSPETCALLHIEGYLIRSGRYEIGQDNEAFTIVF
jgi:hypothetical protein